MKLFTRVARSRLPKSARQSAGVPVSERVIAWAPEQRDPHQFVIATNTGIYAKGSSIPWASIIRAQWNEPFLELITEQPGGSSQRLRIPLDEPGNLPAAVYTQVTANVIVSERLTLANGSQCLAAARRQAGDEITWTVVFDEGVDPTDPENRAQADFALTELRSALGI
ncbi:MAG: hypothetical protein Q8L05_03190 [Actinomycetota bacterium]|nr:hypothetical protein [Actinomycetota bacterium]MDP2289510.1 hypothetical protein [Actinomycetota bacterium]